MNRYDEIDPAKAELLGFVASSPTCAGCRS